MTFLRATCQQPDDAGPRRSLTKTEYDQLPLLQTRHYRYDAGTKGYAGPSLCTLDTTDAAVFEAHMADVHNRKRGTVDRPTVSSTGFRREVWRPALPAKPWKVTRAGRLYAPKPRDPGAEVSWRELVETGQTYHDEELGRTQAMRGSIERTGQVWSAGWAPASMWVVPYLPFRNELAVLLQPGKVSGEFQVISTYDREQTREELPPAPPRPGELGECTADNCVEPATHWVVAGGVADDDRPVCERHGLERTDGLRSWLQKRGAA